MHSETPESYRSILSRSTEKIGRIRLSKLEVQVRDLPKDLDGITAIQITDIHAGAYTPSEHVRACIDIAKSLNSDLVFFTGDFIHVGRKELRKFLMRALGPTASKYRHYRRLARSTTIELARELEDLKAPLGVFAVWGNHDHLEGIRVLNRYLPDHIRPLVNESLTISKGASQFLISGVDDYREGSPDLALMIENNSPITQYPLRILLAHNPDTTLLPGREILSDYDLILSGHTHGGQVCLPGEIPIKTETRQRDYYAGFKRFLSAPMYISNGIGNSGVPLRIFCPPEIVHVTFKSLKI